MRVITGERLTAAVPLILVALLAALTFWLDRVAQLPERGPAGRRDDPDYIVEKLTAVSMNAAGSPRYSLSAAKMVHYPEGETTLLTAPKFVNHEAAKAPVTITANEAVVSANGQHVYFQDNVRVTRAAHDKHSELVVTTSFLHLIPDRNIARTDRAVKLTDAAMTMTAEGFELDSETRVMRLLSKVQGTYDPRKAPRR